MCVKVSPSLEPAEKHHIGSIGANESLLSLAIDLGSGSETITGMHTMAIYKRGRIHSFAAFGLQAQ